MRKSIIFILIVAIMTTFLFGCGENETKHIERDDWATDVKTAVNDFVDTYGVNSKNYDDNSYVVFDFDNTSSIFDIEEQLAIYQLQTMAFSIKPNELSNILSTGLSDLEEDLTDLGYGKGSYSDWIDDITSAYSILYNTYGPFTANGLDKTAQQEIQLDEEWQEFSTKMRALYDLIYDNESASVAYPWVLYWFTGMTENEVYNLAKKSHIYYKDVETSIETWTSPESITSKVGVVTYNWTKGVQVTVNIKELWNVLSENGIDVWVCSASGIDVVRAGIDVFGLHDYCTGVIAMTNKLNNDKYINEYDYNTGYFYYANEDGSWTKGDKPSKSQTQGEGKVTAINNILVNKYGSSPLAGFMDSTGDFNFCTEYNSLKLVVCFNRANRKVTDGGGLIAEVAIYERDYLGYNLKSANSAGDTLYVLQGRDENGIRTFRNSNKTLTLGTNEEKLFKNQDNDTQLLYMIDNNMTVKNIIDTFSLKTSANDINNKLGFKYGFLTEFAGYHSK